MNFSNTLIYWYLQTKRDLPWRKTRDPYLVWLSEIILQQTRVSQGMSYYLTFSSVFPTVEDLANAEESKVLKMWQGLGYYSRARNLHFTAKYVSNELSGVFPTSYKELIKLKGIGDYTASAISSICFDEPAAVVDGNVYRVLSRFFKIETPINSTKGIKEFKDLAQSLLDTTKPGVYNQAIMDFGALQCKPKSPNCYECPMSTNCIAFENKLVKQLPIKEKKLKIKKKYFNFFVFVTKKNKTIFEERKGKGIWQGLYQFPLIETINEVHVEDLDNLPDFQALVPENAVIQLFNENSIIHKLSHQHLFTKFWIIKTDDHKKATTNWDTLELFPTSVLIANFMKEYNLKLNQIF
ncbi:MAG: A/G-specific adenine glycosylase [Flavobacteriaceae bacterium]|nr:A/G-specific adenine glycosylase [Flavobacteriaceae bacterium]MDG2443837.1 A/G-specific adenine glycosylase [Flavobacteriaceae bacterium]